MNLTVLEDMRVWGLLPREITRLAAYAMLLSTVALIFLAIVELPAFYFAALLTATAMVYLVRLTFVLRRLAYSAGENV